MAYESERADLLINLLAYAQKGYLGGTTRIFALPFPPFMSHD